MDNFNSSSPPNENLAQPVSLGDAGVSKTSVSHSPLNLGGSAPVAAPKIETPKPVPKKPTEKVVSTERIAGVKTFFTKLHAGAINFLDEQITKWLNENPDIAIKRTNVVTGPIQGKKTEPNIIITVWY